MRQCPKCGLRFSGPETVCPNDGSVLDAPASFEEKAIGRTLDGKYRIDGFVSRGGMGSVFRGTHVMLNKPVAIKLIKPELVSSNEVVERFLREARAAAALGHPNIVTVHDLGQTSDGTLYIAMELVDGSSLKERIRSEGAWEPRRAVRLAKAVSKALALAHDKGIVHRDLKPQNIMVERSPDGDDVPKLLDFGIAKTLEPESPQLTATGVVLGTPHYMSAEQAKGLPADPRSDLYALGVILYEMLVGEVPFNDASIPQILVKHLSEPPRRPSTLNANIPASLEEVVLRCLEKDPEKRYQSASELIEALDHVPDTAVDLNAVPTVATAPPVPKTGAAQTTLAGASAAASAPPPLPVTPSSASVAPFPDGSKTSTIRARELEASRADRKATSRLPWIVAVVLLLFVIVGLSLRSRTNAPTSVAQVTSAAEPAVEPETPAEEPAPNESRPAAEPVEAGSPEASVATAPPPDETAEDPPAAPVVQPIATPEPVQAESVPPPPPSLPAKPRLAVECEGLRDGCGALRFSIAEAGKRKGILPARPARADVLLSVGVEEVEARQVEQFGTTFIVRTYSFDVMGASRHFDDELLMPPETVTFDARLGRDKLREQTRLLASDIIDAVEAYWQDHR